eukprot:4269940-Amphidinium_carterae.1
MSVANVSSPLALVAFASQPANLHGDVEEDEITPWSLGYDYSTTSSAITSMAQPPPLPPRETLTQEQLSPVQSDEERNSGRVLQTGCNHDGDIPYWSINPVGRYAGFPPTPIPEDAVVVPPLPRFPIIESPLESGKPSSVVAEAMELTNDDDDFADDEAYSSSNPDSSSDKDAPRCLASGTRLLNLDHGQHALASEISL